MSISFGLSEQDKQFLEKTIRSVLGDTRGEVWVFGSRATGKYRKYSDIDLLIESEDLGSRKLRALIDTFEESYFPYKVDLVDARNLAPEYRNDVEKTKRKFFRL